MAVWLLTCIAALKGSTRGEPFWSPMTRLPAVRRAGRLAVATHQDGRSPQIDKVGDIAYGMHATRLTLCPHHPGPGLS